MIEAVWSLKEENMLLVRTEVVSSITTEVPLDDYILLKEIKIGIWLCVTTKSAYKPEFPTKELDVAFTP